jgi:hypothetical protein
MSEKEKFIQEVYDAIWTEIQEYDYAHNSKKGLLEHLQGYSWKFDQDLCDKYFGQSTRHFGIFDTQVHLNEFIKSMSVKL